MHFLGVAGHMRRIYNPLQYEFLYDMQWWNVFITMSAFCLGLSQLIFFGNFIWSLIAGKRADKKPVGSQYARMDGALAAGPRQLRDNAHGLSRSV